MAAVGINALIFDRWPFRSVGAWDMVAPTPPAARAAAVLSLGLWTGTVCRGRLLAYF